MNKHDYSYNNMHLIRDGKPWQPAMGEMHFSRCRREDWRKSIKLMKAGGIDIVSTYIFWNHHEAEAGKFDFTGCRDIRHFLDICAEEDMLVWLRIGPWSHGEAKHGGFPDWLLKEVKKPRSNDPDYMKYVRRLWTALFEQVKEHIDGCILALQYENEYVSTGPGCGNEHMNELVRLAEEIGFKAALRSSTYSHDQFIGPCLPMHGGYPDHPWDGRTEKLAPNMNYVINKVRYGLLVDTEIREIEREDIWCDLKDVPYMFCEMGAGCQPTLHRRPLIQPHDVSAILNAKLGAGTVMPGFYMYHGGTNPGFGLHECKAFGNSTDVPELCYDFQAPIGEYVKTSGAYCTLRRTFTFLRDYGELLAAMPAVIPEDNPQNPDDLEHLRYSFRTDGERGFLFVNNYVRGYEMAEHTRRFTINAGGREITFPEMKFRSGDYGFYPFNLPMGNGTLLSTNANPLCILDGKTYVFFADGEVIYNTEGDVSDVKILTLTKEEALKASKITVKNRDYLILCDAPYVRQEDELVFYITHETQLRVYPNPEGMDGFAEYTLNCPAQNVSVRSELMNANPLMKEFAVAVDAMPDGAEDVILDIDYDGSIAELFIDGRKAADQFSMGNGWKIGLKRFEGAKNYVLRIFALAENVPIYMDEKPVFKGGFACELKKAAAIAEYAVRFSELNG